MKGLSGWGLERRWREVREEELQRWKGRSGRSRRLKVERVAKEKIGGVVDVVKVIEAPEDFYQYLRSRLSEVFSLWSRFSYGSVHKDGVIFVARYCTLEKYDVLVRRREGGKTRRRREGHRGKKEKAVKERDGERGKN